MYGSANKKAASESLHKSDRWKVTVISFPLVFGQKNKQNMRTKNRKIGEKKHWRLHSLEPSKRAHATHQVVQFIRYYNCSDKLPYFVYLVFKLHIVSYANDSDANAAESKALQLIHTTITLVRVCFLILAWMLPGNGCSTGHLVTGLPGGKVDLRLTFWATHSKPVSCQ